MSDVYTSMCARFELPPAAAKFINTALHAWADASEDGTEDAAKTFVETYTNMSFAELGGIDELDVEEWSCSVDHGAIEIWNMREAWRTRLLFSVLQRMLTDFLPERTLYLELATYTEDPQADEQYGQAYAITKDAIEAVSTNSPEVLALLDAKLRGQLELSPVVRKFAEAMERQLRVNDHKNGKLGMAAEQLMVRLREETDELHDALWLDANDPAAAAAAASTVTRKAANVANFALFIAEKFGDLTNG